MSPASPAGQRVTVDQVHAAIGARNMDLAISLAERALAEGLEHPSVLNLAAYKLELEGRLEEALGLLERALRLEPTNHFVLNSIGVCHIKSERPEAALRAFDAALAVAPGYPQAHHGRGLALAMLGDRQAAKAEQQQAAALDPRFPEPVGVLAAAAAEDEDWDAAERLARQALSLDPEQTAAQMALTVVDINRSEFKAAEARMTRLIDSGRLASLHAANALNHRGDARQGAGRFEAAMQDYIAANKILRSVRVPSLKAPELGLDLCKRLIGYFEAAPADAWRPIPETTPTDGEIGHVFLVGFARSGTTLLEQILASHGQMVALEEKPTLDDAILEFFPYNAGLDRVAAMTEEEALSWRQLYWRRVREFEAEPRGKVLIDKLPLHTIYIPLIARLFPRAKILLARRDPRDVVVSCFRHRFRSNPLTVEFNDLGRTAEVYAGFMRLAEIYGEKLTIPIHVHRHEDLIDDLDRETQAICDFIGVEWDENMRNFVETANRRRINTPSKDQVRRSLNRDGVASWRRYGDAIAEIHPILAPWVEKFGYPRS